MEPKEKQKQEQRETDSEVKVTSLLFSYLHLRCYGLVLCNRTTTGGDVEGPVSARVRL